MKRKHLLNIFALCFALSVPSFLLANSDENLAVDSVKNEVQSGNQKDLLDRIDKLDKLVAQLPKISGYMQTGYVWGDKNGGNNSTFQMKRMRLIVDKKISPMFDFRAQFEVFSSSTDGKLGKKVMAVMDAFANVHLHKSLHFRAGQYYLPLGFENYDISPATLETIDFSNINYRMVCRNAVTLPNHIDYGRDIGVMAYGDAFESADKKFNYLSYNLSVSNGAMITQTDDNKSKDFVGRITVRPIEKLRVIGSYNWGEYVGIDKEGLAKKHMPMNRVIVGAWYLDPNGLTLRSEYGHIECNDANVKEDGLYVLAGYRIGKLLPVARWDMYRDNGNKTSPNNRDALLVGCTYAPINYFKLQFAYTHTMYTKKVKDHVANGLSGNGNGIQVMAVAYF